MSRINQATVKHLTMELEELVFVKKAKVTNGPMEVSVEVLVGDLMDPEKTTELFSTVNNNLPVGVDAMINVKPTLWVSLKLGVRTLIPRRKMK